MSDSKPSDPKAANSGSVAMADSANFVPKPIDKNTSPFSYDATAPPQCEMCNTEVPDMATRAAHMAETKHCHCFECNAYVPPGCLYSHWSDAHENLVWNDHAVAWTDRENKRNAMPWAREAWEKANEGR